MIRWLRYLEWAPFGCFDCRHRDAHGPQAIPGQIQGRKRSSTRPSCQ